MKPNRASTTSQSRPSSASLVLRLAAIAVATLAAACGGPDRPVPANSAKSASEPATQESPAKEDALPSFDFAKVPLSDAPLGAFPYFQLPEGYVTPEGLSSTFETAKFPFWIGDRYVWVEGRVHQANIRALQRESFSALELEQGIERMVAEAGGVELADAKIPDSASKKVRDRAFLEKFRNGLCWPSEPVRTFVVHRTDKVIWVRACTYGNIGGAWVIAQADTAPPEAVAPMGSKQLRARLDADGSVDVQIHFVSDSDRMLSGSQRQITAIAEMLQDDLELNLSVNGHTDNTGSAERNKELSLLRAQRVVDALVERGIEASRLTAHGFGRERPVADNATAEGRARNRRVELEKI